MIDVPTITAILKLLDMGGITVLLSIVGVAGAAISWTVATRLAARKQQMEMSQSGATLDAEIAAQRQ